MRHISALTSNSSSLRASSALRYAWLRAKEHRIVSEAVGNEGRLVSAIETTLVRAAPRAGTRRRRSGRGS
jgi:hypothetical protein